MTRKEKATRVFIALGANLGEPIHQFEQAIEDISVFVYLLARAPIYKTRPIGITDQPTFYNSVLAGTTRLGPRELLSRLKDIELRMGRTPTVKDAPRYLDLDIVLYANDVIDLGALHIPHRSMTKRDFVLQPLVDLDPKLIDPVTGKPLTDLLTEVSETTILEKVTGLKVFSPDFKVRG